MKQTKYITVQLTKEQKEILATQFGARIDHFSDLILKEAKNENLERVEQLVEYKKKMQEIQNILFNTTY